MRHIREMKSRYPMTYNHEVLTGPGVVESIYKATDGDCDYLHRSWAEPDVGCTIL